MLVKLRIVPNKHFLHKICPSSFQRFFLPWSTDGFSRQEKNLLRKFCRVEFCRECPEQSSGSFIIQKWSIKRPSITPLRICVSLLTIVTTFAARVTVPWVKYRYTGKLVTIRSKWEVNLYEPDCIFNKFTLPSSRRSTIWTISNFWLLRGRSIHAFFLWWGFLSWLLSSSDFKSDGSMHHQEFVNPSIRLLAKYVLRVSKKIWNISMFKLQQPVSVFAVSTAANAPSNNKIE